VGLTTTATLERLTAPYTATALEDLRAASASLS
jgi:hypothetical protein